MAVIFNNASLYAEVMCSSTSTLCEKQSLLCPHTANTKPSES